MVGIRRMNHQVERAAVTQSNGGEVTDVTRGQSTDAERLGKRYDRTIDEPQAQIREASVHFHRTRELADGWRRVSEGAARDIPHEHLHRPALVAKEVIDLCEHETRNVTCACLVNGSAKEPVVWRALNEVVDKRTGIADKRSRATGRHRIARARCRALQARGPCRRFAAWDVGGTARALGRAAAG